MSQLRIVLMFTAGIVFFFSVAAIAHNLAFILIALLALYVLFLVSAPVVRLPYDRFHDSDKQDDKNHNNRSKHD